MVIQMELDELFKEMIQKIEIKLDLKAVIVFGSRTRGNAHYYSDYDIVIIANFKESFFKRSDWIIEITPDVSTDIFCYTPEEFELLFNDYHLTAIDSIGEGIVLFGEEFINPYKVRYQDFIRRGMKKTNCVLIPPKN